MNRTMKTLWVNSATKEGLDDIKVIPEEPYDKVIQRLLSFFNKHNGELKIEGVK